MSPTIKNIQSDYKKIYAAISSNDIDKVRGLLKQALGKSVEIGYEEGINKYYESKINISYQLQKHVESINMIKELNKKFIEQDNKKGLAELYKVLGVTLTMLSDFVSSTYYLKKSLEISINLKPFNLYAITASYIGLAYNAMIQKRYDKAINYYDLGLEYYTSDEEIDSNSSNNYYYLLINKTLLLIKQNKIKQAKKMFYSFEKNYEKFKSFEQAYFLKIRIEFLLNENYNHENLLNLCSKLLKNAEEISDVELEIDACNLLKKHYLKIKNYSKALEFSNKIISIHERHPKQVSILKLNNNDNELYSKNTMNQKFVIFSKIELLQAATYQNNFHKKDFYSPKLDIKTHYDSAKTLSGDYLGSFNLDKTGNYFLFILADVISESIAGTYISFLLEGIIKSIIFNADTYDLKKIINDINYILADSLKNQGFVTLWAGIVDLNKNTLESVNAGGIPSYLVTEGKKLTSLNKGCTILGMFKKLPEYESSIYKFNKGDSILSFSEGVKKTINTSKNNFDESIKNLILKYAENKDTNFKEQLIENIEEHKQQSQMVEDISCLVIDYNS